MTHKFKKIFTLIFVFVCLLACVSCSKCNKCKKCNKNLTPEGYCPLEIPQLSDPNGTFMKVGNYTVTNQQAYYQLLNSFETDATYQMLNSFGIEAMMSIIDENLITTTYDENDFKEYLDEIIYGDEEHTQDNFDKFINELPLFRLSNNPSDANYYETFYRLRFKRIQYAKDKFKNEVSSDYFTQERKESEFNSLYRKENNLIIIRFTSLNEARYFMEKHNVNPLSETWQSLDGTNYTPEEIQTRFEEIYSDYYNTKDTAVKKYTYDDLSAISALLASDVYTWKEKTHSKVPTSYKNSTGTFLIYKVSETGNLDNGQVVTYAEKESEVMESLINEEITNAFVTLKAMDVEIANGLIIYDPALENSYKLYYDVINQSLGKTENQYTAFAKSNEESKVNAFSYVKDGVRIYVTAQTLYERLLSFYSDYVAALFVKQYLILKDNGVVDLGSLGVINQEKYDQYYSTDVKPYFDEFNANKYETISYPTTYGWNNFLRDFFGLLSDQHMVINFDSSLYNANLAKYKENLFLDKNKTDSLVQAEMEKIFNEYLYLTAISVSAYFDKDLDNKADEVEENSSQATLLKQLVETVYSEVERRFDYKVTIAKILSDIQLEYNRTNKDKDTVWKVFKENNIVLKIGNSQTFTNQSIVSDKLKETLQVQYKNIIKYKQENNGVDLSGQDLSKGYTYTFNSTTKSVNSLTFFDKETYITFDENTYSTAFAIKANKQYYIDEKVGSYKPTLEMYHKYYEDPSSLKDEEKKCVYYYYLVAIENIINANELVKTINVDSINLINTVEFTYPKKDSLINYINICNQAIEAEEN